MAHLGYLYNHLFLPRKLPRGDEAPDHISFTTLVIEALKAFRDEGTYNIDAALSLMQTTRQTLHATNCFLAEDGVQHALQAVLAGESASLYVDAQNAGLIIQPLGPDRISFAMFELSPTNASIYNTHDRLIREFPGTIVSIPRDIFGDPNFQAMFIDTIVTMSQQAVGGTRQQVMKAFQLHDENRGTTSPEIVTELLSSMLRGFGQLENVEGIKKNTREEIMWKNSALPWRRSPFWLLIRVSLQLAMRSTDNQPDSYKPFMAFLMSRVLQEAVNIKDTPSEMIAIMMAKVSRRMKKLSSPRRGPWLITVHDTVAQASECLKERWVKIQSQSEIAHKPGALNKLDPAKDVELKLDCLDTFIDSIHQRTHHDESEAFHPREPFTVSSPQQLPSINGYCETRRMPLQLAEVESWVKCNLEGWLADNITDDSSCRDLKGLLINYHTAAECQYHGNPETISRMHLTVLEIWIAIDRAAIHATPSIDQYQPEIPVAVYQGLALGCYDEMERLAAAEQYLNNRHTDTSRHSILRNFGHRNSFQVSYVDGSPPHLQLLDQINRDAQNRRQKKETEFNNLRAEYRYLVDQANAISCEQVEVTESDKLVLRHYDSCRRCRMVELAKELCIDIDEWPLPPDLGEAKAVVFELNPPPRFSSWRDATLFLIDNVLKSDYPEPHQPTAAFPLSKYDALLPYRNDSIPPQRIILFSEIKPHTATHRKAKPIGELLSASQVCLSNGLKFRYLDKEHYCFLRAYMDSHSLPEACNFAGFCISQLKPFLCRNHTKPDGSEPNKVIATQFDCPDKMRLTEYKALGTLPYGHRLGWMNLLRQLAMPETNFNTASAASFILQTTLQAGPNPEETPHRSPHTILLDPTFVNQMITHLLDVVSRIEENWESYTALWVYTSISVRLLSMATRGMEEQLLALVKRCREVSYRWLHLTQSRLDAITDEEQAADFQSIVIDIALVCSNSFYTGHEHLEKILYDTHQASILLEVSTFICNSASMFTKDNDEDDDDDVDGIGLQTIMRDRWAQVMHRSRLILGASICKGDMCLDISIRKNWPAFSPGGAWKLLTGRAFCWLETSFEGLKLHFNLLTAELLVNGHPQSRLPEPYLEDQRYQELFGFSVLGIVPGHLPELEYRAAKPIQGYTVNFGMQASSFEPSPAQELLVRLETETSTLDLVPRQCFQGMLPESFVHNYVHWYCHETEQVQFHELQSPLTPCSDGWALVGDIDAWSWTLEGHGKKVVSPCSHTANRISLILRPLESKLYLNLIRTESSKILSVQAPRLHLDFSWHQGCKHLMSNQFRGMNVDLDQSLGTLIGFESKLVLRNPRERKVLVPDGVIAINPMDGSAALRHVNVSMVHGSAKRVVAYTVDEILGSFKDDGLLESKLTLAYLHALTSFSVTDPLTWRTGTERALEILNSACVRSPGYLSEHAMKTLGRIALLSPHRSFYPRDKRVMQSVTWMPELSSLAQDARYYTVVQDILYWTAEVSFLRPSDANNIDRTCIQDSSNELVERDIRHISRYSVSGLGAEISSTGPGALYRARDTGQQSTRVLDTVNIAKRAFNGSDPVSLTTPTAFAENLYNLLASGGPVPSGDVLEPHELRYDSKWLDPPQRLGRWWCSVHRSCQANRDWLNKYQLVNWIACVSYAEGSVPLVTQALLTLILEPSVASVSLPAEHRYVLAEGTEIKDSMLEGYIKDHVVPLDEAPEGQMVPFNRERGKKFRKRQKDLYEDNLHRGMYALTTHLKDQWPCALPVMPDETATAITHYIDVGPALVHISSPWNSCFFNLLFWRYLDGITKLIQTIPVVGSAPEAVAQYTFTSTEHTLGFLSIDDIFSRPAPEVEQVFIPPIARFPEAVTTTSRESGQLSSVLIALRGNATTVHERRYVDALQESSDNLRTHVSKRLDRDQMHNLEESLAENAKACLANMGAVLKALVSATSPAYSRDALESLASDKIIDHILVTARLQPRVSPSFLLGQLRSCVFQTRSQPWKRALITFGLAVSNHQQAMRLERLKTSETDFLREFDNIGHGDWNLDKFSDWLLLECESDIKIRKVQHQIAGSMINPPNGVNAVMQLNMGEGKSSVIVPMVTAALADHTRLVRVIVAKPQARQMHQMLTSKLSGLLDRPVFEMQFSRSIKMDVIKTKGIRKILTQLQSQGGVMMIQPEHLLSFQLMGLECGIGGEDTLAYELLSIQKFFNTFSRDIVDESDENFNVKFELIYTIGAQRPIEYSPHRWVAAQDVLKVFADCCLAMHQDMPQSIEIEDLGPGRVPRIRILDTAAQNAIIIRVASQICLQGLSGFPVGRQPEEMRVSVLTYITVRSLTTQQIGDVEKSSFWSDLTRPYILLLRGLFAGGILGFVFAQKRWRVDYGLDENRERKTRVAVPYRAKDNPTPRSEFSHPDVVILLTSLNYYYSGLEDADLFALYDLLMNDDNPDANYEAWVKTAPTLPKCYRQLQGVNLKDRALCEAEIFPHIRYSKGAIDYFLSKLVFAKECKEYPHKLSASGWDLGKIKGKPTTGFSGTNDSRYLLPLAVRQLDLPEQMHTNALVLEYLLRDENGIALVPPQIERATLDSAALLEMINETEEDIRVILDVGAQVIDLSNEQFARGWLEQHAENAQIQGVVFFNDDDEIVVLDRSGSIEELQRSPFIAQLDQCLVFLDEAHTRGTDLKLPVNYRAAVTLGANLTKDRLVQGEFD
jgi:hypothetical protein